VSKVFLRVKIASLMEEARIIRREERRVFQSYKLRRRLMKRQQPLMKRTLGRIALRDELRGHRLGVVKYEARHSQLAYAFLRGVAYSRIEREDSSSIDLYKVSRLIERFGHHSVSKDEVWKWVQGDPWYNEWFKRENIRLLR